MARPSKRTKRAVTKGIKRGAKAIKRGASVLRTYMTPRRRSVPKSPQPIAPLPPELKKIFRAPLKSRLSHRIQQVPVNPPPRPPISGVPNVPRNMLEQPDPRFFPPTPPVMPGMPRVPQAPPAANRSRTRRTQATTRLLEQARARARARRRMR
jgi:hypothetical protein